MHSGQSVKLTNWHGWAVEAHVDGPEVALTNTVDGRNPAPLGNHGKPLFVGIYKKIIIPRFLRWCRISSIHSMSGVQISNLATIA